MNIPQNNQFFSINLMANAPAARQLLLNHVNSNNYYDVPGPGSGKFYDPNSHPFRSQFTSDLAALGSVPQNVERMISIADGSANGQSTGNVGPGEEFLRLVFPKAVITDPRVGFYAIGLGVIVNPNSFLGTITAQFPFQITWPTATANWLDSAPGSPFALQSLVPPGESTSADGKTKVRVEYPDEQGKTFGFIPTFSALGINTGDPFFDISVDATSSSTGFEHDLTPFDRIFLIM